jgi:hypothetical protein
MNVLQYMQNAHELAEHHPNLTLQNLNYPTPLPTNTS